MSVNNISNANTTLQQFEATARAGNLSTERKTGTVQSETTVKSADSVNISEQARTLLAREAQVKGNGEGIEPPLKTKGNGEGIEPPAGISTYGNGEGIEPPAVISTYGNGEGIEPPLSTRGNGEGIEPPKS